MKNRDDHKATNNEKSTLQEQTPKNEKHSLHTNVRISKMPHGVKIIMRQKRNKHISVFLSPGVKKDFFLFDLRFI